MCKKIDAINCYNMDVNRATAAAFDIGWKVNRPMKMVRQSDIIHLWLKHSQFHCRGKLPRQWNWLEIPSENIACWKSSGFIVQLFYKYSEDNCRFL